MGPPRHPQGQPSSLEGHQRSCGEKAQLRTQGVGNVGVPHRHGHGHHPQRLPSQSASSSHHRGPHPCHHRPRPYPRNGTPASHHKQASRHHAQCAQPFEPAVLGGEQQQEEGRHQANMVSAHGQEMSNAQALKRLFHLVRRGFFVAAKDAPDHSCRGTGKHPAQMRSPSHRQDFCQGHFLINLQRHPLQAMAHGPHSLTREVLVKLKSSRHTRRTNGTQLHKRPLRAWLWNVRNLHPHLHVLAVDVHAMPNPSDPIPLRQGHAREEGGPHQKPLCAVRALDASLMVGRDMPHDKTHSPTRTQPGQRPFPCRQVQERRGSCCDAQQGQKGMSLQQLRQPEATRHGTGPHHVTKDR